MSTNPAEAIARVRYALNLLEPYKELSLVTELARTQLVLFEELQTLALRVTELENTSNGER